MINFAIDAFIHEIITIIKIIKVAFFIVRYVSTKKVHETELCNPVVYQTLHR